MNAQQAIEIIERLPPERQAEVFDFIEFISQRTPAAPDSAPPSPLREAPALGIWANREDMRDSVAWVQDMRRREWKE